MPQMIAEVIEEMGFDSIILKNAEDRFSTMSMDQGTAHVHIFDSNKTNIKSATGNIGTFSAADPDIRFSKVDVYHRGTYRGGLIRDERRGTGENNAILGPGIYFTNSPSIANLYKKFGGVGTKTKLDLEKLWDPIKGTPLKRRREWPKIWKDLGLSEAEVDRLHNRASTLRDGRGGLGALVSHVGPAKARKILVDHGIQGAIESLPDGDSEIAIFDDELLKGAEVDVKFSKVGAVDSQRLSQFKGEVLQNTDEKGRLGGGRLHYAQMLDEMNAATLEAVKLWSHGDKARQFYFDEMIDDMIRVKFSKAVKPTVEELKQTAKEKFPKTSIEKLRALAKEDREDKDPFVVEDNSTLADSFVYNVIDKLAPISKIYKAVGGDIAEIADFRLKEQLRVSKAKEQIDEAEEKYIEPIKKKVGEAGLDVEKVDEFLYARHAPEANARLRLTNARDYLNRLAKAQKGGSLKKQIDAQDALFEKGFPTKEVQEFYLELLNSELEKASTKAELEVKKKWEAFSAKPSGMTDVEAAKLSKKWADNKAMPEIAKLFDKMNDETLDISHAAGRMTDDEYNAIKGTFDHYAPLMREGFKAKGLSFGTGKGVTNLGSDVKARGGSTKRAVDLLANAIVNHEKAIINARKADVAKTFLNFVRANPNENFWSFEQASTKPAYDGQGNIRRVPSQEVKDNEVKIKVEGETFIISVNPDNVHAMRMLDGVKGDDNAVSIPLLPTINRYLASINTTLNPEFIISNLSRDLQTAAYNLNDTQVSNVKLSIFKNVPNAMAGLKSLFRGDKSHPWAKVAKQYSRSGAKIGWIDYTKDTETRARKLESEIDIFRKGHTSKKAVKKLFQFIDDYNSIVENAVRLSTFKAGLDNGMSEQKAAIMAKNLTVNFNQKGKYGPLINSLYLFANAGLQGSTRIITTLKNSPQARKAVAGSILAAAGLSMANSVIGGDDDDGVPYYDKVDDFIKSRNMIFMIPNSKGKFIKIPLPWGYNVFWALGTEVGDAATQEDYDPLKGTTRMVGTVLDAFNPLQSASIAQMISPTITDPIAYVAENKTFFGSPLMPEDNQFAKNQKPQSEKYWSSVRPMSKFITKELNSFTGGDKIKPGVIDISPEVLDLAIDTLTGGSGRFIADTLMLPVSVAKGDTDLKNIPFVRRLAGKPSVFKESTKFRENVAHVYEVNARIKEFPAKAKKLKQDKTYRMLADVKFVEKRIRNMKKQMKTANDKRKAKLEQDIRKIKQKLNKKFQLKKDL